MNRLFYFFLFTAALIPTAQAQLALKINLPSLLDGNIYLSGELPLSPSFGMEQEIGLNTARIFAALYTGFGYNLYARTYGKFYFQKETHAGFYLSPYLDASIGSLAEIAGVQGAGPSSLRWAAGGAAGYKWQIGEHLLLEGAFGYSHAFINRLEPPGLRNPGLLARAMIGYRFSGRM